MHYQHGQKQEGEGRHRLTKYETAVDICYLYFIRSKLMNSIRKEVSWLRGVRKIFGFKYLQKDIFQNCTCPKCKPFLEGKNK